MRHKGYYLVYWKINEHEPDGIEKKILFQKRMFEEKGIQMEFKILEKKNGTFWNYRDDLSDADFIYFRKSTITDWRFVGFFKHLKIQGNPLIFMEIPTYPYEGEYGNSFKSKIRLWIDGFFRKRLSGVIDRIVVTGADVGDKLWNVPTISIVNGIDFSSVTPRRYKEHDGLALGCIAKFSPWHGYERLIKGLATYYKEGGSQDVKLLMVGDGPERTAYQQLVEQLRLSSHVKFTGKLTGEALDDVYNLIDVGICSLGRYKSGVDIIGDLKSREFMAKGIPMVCGCKIDVLQDVNYEYVKYFPNDNSELNIPEIINFYRKLTNKNSVKEISAKIQRISKRIIDYRVIYQKVINELEMIWRR